VRSILNGGALLESHANSFDMFEREYSLSGRAHLLPQFRLELRKEDTESSLDVKLFTNVHGLTEAWSGTRMLNRRQGPDRPACLRHPSRTNGVIERSIWTKRCR